MRQVQVDVITKRRPPVEAPKVNGAPQIRRIKNPSTGFSQYERRVQVQQHRGVSKSSAGEVVLSRWFVCPKNACRRVSDFILENGKVGDVFTVDHIRGLHYMTATIKANGSIDMKQNPDAFVEL